MHLVHESCSFSKLHLALHLWQRSQAPGKVFERFSRKLRVACEAIRSFESVPSECDMQDQPIRQTLLGSVLSDGEIMCLLHRLIKGRRVY
jgi:hypothetical protein